MLRWPGGAEAAPEAASTACSQRAAPAGPAPSPPQHISELRGGLVQRGSCPAPLPAQSCTKPTFSSVTEALPSSTQCPPNTCLQIKVF